MSEVHKTSSRRERMNEFIAKYADKIQGVLTGFDRLVFRGSLRKIAYVFGMKGYLWANQVLLKDFGAHVRQISERVKQASLQCVLDAGRGICAIVAPNPIAWFPGFEHGSTQVNAQTTPCVM